MSVKAKIDKLMKIVLRARLLPKKREKKQSQNSALLLFDRSKLRRCKRARSPQILLRSRLRGKCADAVFVQKMTEAANGQVQKFGGFCLIAARPFESI